MSTNLYHLRMIIIRVKVEFVGCDISERRTENVATVLSGERFAADFYFYWNFYQQVDTGLWFVFDRLLFGRICLNQLPINNILDSSDIGPPRFSDGRRVRNLAS